MIANTEEKKELDVEAAAAVLRNNNPAHPGTRGFRRQNVGG